MIDQAIRVLVTAVLVVAILWLWRDTGDGARIASLATGIFWLVLPSLVFFVALPWLLRAGYAFWPSLALAAGLTAAAYFAMVRILARFGIAI